MKGELKDLARVSSRVSAGLQTSRASAATGPETGKSEENDAVIEEEIMREVLNPMNPPATGTGTRKGPSTIAQALSQVQPQPQVQQDRQESVSSAAQLNARTASRRPEVKAKQEATFGVTKVVTSQKTIVTAAPVDDRKKLLRKVLKKSELSSAPLRSVSVDGGDFDATMAILQSMNVQLDDSTSAASVTSRETR